MRSAIKDIQCKFKNVSTIWIEKIIKKTSHVMDDDKLEEASNVMNAAKEFGIDKSVISYIRKAF